MRDLTALKWDPDVLRTLPYPKLDNQIFLEFNQAFHVVAPAAVRPHAMPCF